MLRIETGLILLALLLAWIRPSLGAAWFERLERRFATLASRRTLAVVLVGVTALAVRAALLPIEPIPEPIVHDEFGYLLAADTFAHGRLTNPTPPMWQHFETFHVMFHPTYASIYPPAQGIILAVGQVVFRNAFWGVWLSVGLMCAAITWMLQGWVSAEWALLGGCLALLRYAAFGYWTDSYWGGAVAAIGGALVLGTLPRINESQRIRDALLMALGFAILANSRPYEGFVFSLPVAAILIAWLFSKKSPHLRMTLRQVVVPMTLVLALAGAWMGYYFWRVTGDPFRMPYHIERQTYAMAPYFVWQPIRPEPVYEHAPMKTMFVEDEMRVLHLFRSPMGLLVRAYLAWSFFVGPVLTFPFLMLAFTAPQKTPLRSLGGESVNLLLIFASFVAGTLLVNFYSPHYSAPATGLIILGVILAIKQLRKWGKAGLILARTVPLVCLISVGMRAAAKPLHIELASFYMFSWNQEPVPAFGRGAIERELGQIPGKHIVIVRYKPDHAPFAEWVYNQADISDSRIIWARDTTPASDQELINDFPGRYVWILDADAKPPALHKFEASAVRLNSDPGK